MNKKMKLSQSAKEIKAQILKELAAEKAAQPPELSDEPDLDLVSAAYDRLAKTDVSSEPIQTTVGVIRVFMRDVLERLTHATIETLNEELLDEDAIKRKQSALGLGHKAGSDSRAPPVLVKKSPEEVISGIHDTWNRVTKGMEDGIADKITFVLNDRISADRYSLVAEKKKATKQLYASREVGELFRRSYDDRQRFQQQEEVRVVEKGWQGKFDEETTALQSRIEHLEFRERLITNKYTEADKLSHELAEQLAAVTAQVLELEAAERMGKSPKKRCSGHTTHGPLHGGGGHTPYSPHSHTNPHSPAHTAHAAHANSMNLSLSGSEANSPTTGPTSPAAAVERVSVQAAAPASPVTLQQNPVHKDPLGNESYNIPRTRFTHNTYMSSGGGSVSVDSASAASARGKKESSTAEASMEASTNSCRSNASSPVPMLEVDSITSHSVSRSVVRVKSPDKEAEVEGKITVGFAAEPGRPSAFVQQDSQSDAGAGSELGGVSTSQADADVNDSEDDVAETERTSTEQDLTQRTHTTEQDLTQRTHTSQGSVLEKSMESVASASAGPSTHRSDHAGGSSVYQSSAEESVADSAEDADEEYTREMGTQYSLQGYVDAEEAAAEAEDDDMLDLDINEIEADAEEDAGDGCNLATRDDESVKSALARALSFDANALLSARSNGSHHSITSVGNQKHCPHCDELRREVAELKQHMVFVEEHLSKTRAQARAGDASPLTVATQGSVGSLEAVEASFYDIAASIHEPPGMRGADVQGSNEDERSNRSQRSTREAIQTDELADDDNDGGENSPAGASRGQSPPMMSPLSPGQHTALGGNFSVLSASYATIDKELARPVVKYKDSEQTSNSRHLGIEGAQGSLDLLSEYGLANNSAAIISTVTAANATDSHARLVEKALSSALGHSGSSLREGDLLQTANLSRANQKKLNNLLQEHARAENEAKEKILSLEFQNVELADKLRSKNFEKSHSDKLHSLQLMERGILLKELARQVNDLKALLAVEKKKNDPEPKKPTHRSGLPVPDVNVRKRANEENARAKTPVALAKGAIVDAIDLDTNKADAGNEGVSYSRLLAASASMPFLSDDYGTYRQGANLNSRTGSRETAGISFSASGRITSPHNTSRGKNISSGKINFLPDILNNTDVQVGADLAALKDYSSLKQLGLGSTKEHMNTQKALELSDVRKKIVTILSERYPPPSAEQLLAVSKAKQRALDQREMALKTQEAKKAAEREKQASVRARAKPKRVRPEDDDW